MKASSVRVSIVTCLLGVFVLCGCSGTYETSSGQSGTFQVADDGNGRIVISLRPDNTTVPGGGGAADSGGAAGTGGDQFGGPSGPGSSGSEGYLPPAPDNGDPPTASGGSGDPVARITAQDALKELRDVYGIRLTGQYNDNLVKTTLTCARQYKPRNTRNLVIDFAAPGTGPRGVGGVYMHNPGATSSAGRIQIYSRNSPHVILHEMTHHITLHPQNTDGRQIALRTSAHVPGMPANPPYYKSLESLYNSSTRRYFPTYYSMTMIQEYWAEFFSHLREMEKGLRAGYPRSRTFDPPQDMRADARALYSSN